MRSAVFLLAVSVCHVNANQQKQGWLEQRRPGKYSGTASAFLLVSQHFLVCDNAGSSLITDSVTRQCLLLGSSYCRRGFHLRGVFRPRCQFRRHPFGVCGWSGGTMRLVRRTNQSPGVFVDTDRCLCEVGATTGQPYQYARRIDMITVVYVR